MTTPRPSLDPRKNPWKRGDLCTLGFEKNGFVLSHTAEYLEVRWMQGGGIERIPTGEIDNLLRVGHAADSIAPGGRTNLQNLEAIEALSGISDGIAERMKTVKNEDEKKELDRLVRRIFASDKCEWDSKNETKLWQMFLKPEKVGLIFKLRERIHRAFCKRHER
jgi:hypothetical protein